MLTGAQVYQLARQAGFSTRDAVTATQIAYGESTWNPAAVNSSSGAAGLMQIHPSHATEYPVLWPKRLDPAANMKMAYYVYKRQGWKAWEAYTNGSYKKVKVGSNPNTGEVSFTPPSGETTHATQLGEEKSTVTIKNPLDALSAIPSQLNKIASNATAIVIAVTLLILAVVILLRKPAANVIKAVKPL